MRPGPSRSPYWALLALTLVACSGGSAAVTPSPASPIFSPTSVPSASSTATATIAPSVSTTATPIPTRSFNLPTALPPTADPVVPLDTMLFGETLVPGCSLPCWRGLVIGKSTYDDARYVFDSSFGEEGVRNVGLKGLALLGAADDHEGIRYLWQVRAGTRAGDFRAAATLDPDNGRLDSLQLGGASSDPSRIEIRLSPVSVIKALGKPDRIYANVEADSSFHEGFGEMMLVYSQEGLIFYFYQENAPVSVVRDGSNSQITQAKFEFCLGRTKAVHNNLIHAEVSIVGPLAGGLDSLSDRQAGFVFPQMGVHRLAPLGELFNAGEDDLTRMALADDQACIESKDLVGEIR